MTDDFVGPLLAFQMRMPISLTAFKSLMIDIPRIAGCEYRVRRMETSLATVLQASSGATQRAHRVAGLASLHDAHDRLMRAVAACEARDTRPRYLGAGGIFDQTPPTASKMTMLPIIRDLCQCTDFRKLQVGEVPAIPHRNSSFGSRGSDLNLPNR